MAERDAAWQKRRHSFSSKRDRIKRNVAEITAQDLLGKSHEELVLLLIHFRRQTVALTEAMDASKAEIDNLNNSAAAGSSDSSLETKAMFRKGSEIC